MAAQDKITVRPLGRHGGLQASIQGFGCMSLTPGFYGSTATTEEEGIGLIRRAVELGVTLFDTSDLYGPYTNEELVGKALAPYRGRVVIATKWGPMLTPEGLKMDGSPENARRCCEGARKRLQVDAIDLFTYRGPPDPKVPLQTTMRALKELVEEGKIRALGLSECSAAQIRAAHAVHPITAIEQEWSLFTRDLEEDLLPTCRELGIAVLAYSPLGRGLLTSTPPALGDGDWRKTSQPRFQKENLDKNLALVANLERLAQKKGCTVGQLALAWVHAKGGPDVFPIPGTKRVKYLEENVAAATIQLSPEEVAELESAVPRDQVAGARYEHLEHATYHAGK